MINKLLLKVKKDMEMTKADMIRDELEDDEFYRGVLSAYQLVFDMADETKAESFIYTNDLKNIIIDGGEEIYMADKGIPKKDGSGNRTGNAGRGGCINPKGTRKARRISRRLTNNQ